ncbi:MAG TPA: transglycosylase SLT domain-containing protein [Pyrinomonadaceae bacterium]
MAINFPNSRLILILVGVVILAGASIPAFMTASCLTRPQTSAEGRALENLRNMTRGGVLPSEDVLVRMESEFPKSKAAALARLVRARIKLNQKDFAAAASLLDTDLIADHSVLGDYALIMRANALEQIGQAPQARIAYEKLVNDYPSSIRARDASLRAANILMQAGDSKAVPLALKDLSAKDDPAALLLAGKAHERNSDSARAVSSYRRLYFYAPDSTESAEAAGALSRLGSSTAAGSADEALTRAEKLYDARKFNDAAQAYGDAFNSFPATATPQTQLRRVIAAASARRTPDAISALNSIPASAGEMRAEALAAVAQMYARGRQWEQARSTIEELRRSFPNSQFTPRAMVAVGQIAKEAKNDADASYFSRTAVNSYKDSIEVAQAQFDLAWEAHEAGNVAESSRLLTEHLAYYADRNTDNRGRSGYWAARDSERAGKLAEARALYQALLGRYDANWYGYLAKQRLEALGNRAPAQNFGKDNIVGRAIANLQTVTVAEETAGPEEEKLIVKADELNNVGLNEWALDELEVASDTAGSTSPKVNLAIAKIYRSSDDNVRALTTLRKSFPDYSQMKPEEMTPEEWDVFYPLAYWDIIVQESRAKNLDPYQVAGLIRQETVFMPRARSSAKAYGLMQVIVPTAVSTAKKYGLNRAITEEALYEPRLSIQLGTAYMKDQLDKFGRIEYLAAAYNAGPHRMVQWRTSLPSEIDEWAEAVPFKETRGYVQGVVRNRLQYQRLYDQNGKFRPEVGSRAITRKRAAGTPAPGQQDPTVIEKPLNGNESGG